jgi:hypothetical protein
MVIFLEDIGIGGLGHWQSVDVICFRLLSLNKLNGPITAEEITMVHRLIWLMCKVPKSRMCSHLNNVSTSTRWPVHIPGVGQILKPGPEYLHFKVAGCLLESAELPKQLQAYLICKQFYEAKQEAAIWRVFSDYPALGITTAIAQRWFKELKIREQFLCWAVLVNAAITGIESTTDQELDVELDDVTWSNNRALVMEFDDYVYDKHTKAKSAGVPKTSSYFAEHGAHVEPESTLVNQAGRVYSIDEESVRPGLRLADELSSKRLEYLQSHYLSYRDRIHPSLVQYLDKEFGITTNNLHIG